VTSLSRSQYPIDNIDVMQLRESSPCWNLARITRCAAVVLALILVAAAAYAGECPGNDPFATLDRKSIPLRFRKPPRLHAVARKLDDAARGILAEAKPFEFQIHFNPWYLPAMKSPPPFSIDGSYESPCNQMRYLAVGWGYGGRTSLTLTANFYQAGKMADSDAVPNPSMSQTPAQPESMDGHPALRKWTVDLPEIGEVIRQHPVLFAYGLDAIDVTTVKRYRHNQALHVSSFGDARFFIRKPDGAHISLKGLNDSRTIVELMETTRARADQPCVEGVKGHYLIIDATTANPLEHGIFMKCETVATHSCQKDSDCPAPNRCEAGSCGPK